MNTYMFKCRQCEHITEITVRHDKLKSLAISCEECGSTDVFRKYGVGQVWHPTKG